MLQQKPFVLVVEDDHSLRKVLARYLQEQGYMVLQAANFREAVDEVEIKPDLVLLDIGLPDATGWDVAEWIESQTTSSGCPVPVIVMSGTFRPGPKQLQRVGAKAFLAKPFPVAELLGLVKRYAPITKTVPGALAQ